MTARKWDRLQVILDKFDWDVFRAIADGPTGEESALEQIRDLRAYLTLIEAEMMARGVVEVGPGTPEDGGHHAASALPAGQ